MKARTVRFHALGGPEVLQIDELELYEPGAGEVCIRVEAIGLNRAEAAFRAGQYLEQPALPSGLGYEAAGVIEALGPGVEGFRAGDAVCVLPAFSMRRYGVYAERAIVPAGALIARRADLPAIEAAALWMAALTAYGGLIDIGRLGRGDAVLITAPSSSVGLAAIQIARAVGAVPIAVTRSADKVEALRGQGAAHVIVNRHEGLDDAVSRVTADVRVVFDPVAGPGVAELARTLAPGGTLVLYGNLSGCAHETPFPFFEAVGKGLSLRGYLVFELLRDPARLAAARAFVERALDLGTLRPVIDRVFEFQEIVEAHRHLESNAQVGKVVVRVA